MKLIVFILAFLFVTLNTSQSQTFISDSITYSYAQQGSPARIASYLRQFGCIDTVTDRTEVSRSGDFIYVRTRLKPDTRVKLIEILVQEGSDYFEETNEDGIKVMKQLINGYASSFIHHTDIDYYNPLSNIESPNLFVVWELLDKDEDGNFELLNLKLVNSKDIIETIHCHVK